MGTIITFGGPILYLVIYGLILLAILVWVDSGSIFPRRLSASRQQQILSHLPDGQASCSEAKKDVAAEAKSVSVSNDLLRVLHITKSFSGNKVVDDVSLGVSRDTTFAMLGPNGAGKTTCFNIIRESHVLEYYRFIAVINRPFQGAMSYLTLAMRSLKVFLLSTILESPAYRSASVPNLPPSIHN